MKNHKAKNAYYINRIRLINFHNFVDELIEVPHGGHLFLLGDNGCGKTTVIDAIHYVLTAGNDMEFNSAARVVGRKNDGRRPQGIISRYNVGRGHMNPDGAVTYAALELKNGSKTTVLAVGMSINSPEDNLARWGIVKDGTLEEIPFLVDDLNGRRPAGKREMRKALNKTGFYGQMGQYSKVVADRFVGGMETFSEFCSFLHMCKAYREIVSHSTDYHSLFKKLLPEKRIDLFETMINALRDIENSTGELDELNRKLDYIAGLESKVYDIGQKQGEIICFRYTGVQNNIDGFERKLKKLKTAQENGQAELAKCEKEIEEQKAELEQSGNLLADLQARDSEGLVEKEKGFVQRQNDLTARLNEIEKLEKKEADAVEDLKKAVDAVAKRLKEALSAQLAACSRLSPGLPFSTATYMQALDELIHASAVESLEALPLDGMRARTDQALADHYATMAELQGRLRERQNKEKEILEALIALNNQAEAAPDIPGFADARKALHEAMVADAPLYRCLEWAPDVSPETRSNIEEAIGDTVLSTFLVRDADWETACTAVLPRFPGIRLARRRDIESGTELADWIRHSFDFNASDPEALLTLDDEMVSRQPLTFAADDDCTSLSFRAHKRGLSGAPARLIGETARREAQARRIAARKAELKVCHGEIEASNRQIADAEKAKEIIEEFRTLLHGNVEQLRERLADLNTKRQDLRHATDNLERCRRDDETVRKELVLCKERISELRKTLEEKGLEKLDERLATCRERHNKAQAQRDELQNQVGKIQQRLESLSDEIDQTQNAMDESAQRHIDIADELLAFCGEGSFLKYLESVQSGWSYDSLDEFNRLYEQAKDERREMQAMVEERLRHPEAASYGFVYDRDENRLYDRNQREIGDLVASLKKSIHEQEEVINDKTTELFRNVIQDSLVRFIIENITRLRDMVKEINKLLGNRTFGMNSYKLNLTPQKDYERFVNTFQNFSAFNSDSTRELRELLEDYKDEILNSEVNTIPTVLDYRNWFRYDMRVSTVGDEDGEVITRRLRSMGSGGEQAVPNYLLIMTIAHFLYRRSNIRTHVMLFDEAFYGIDEERRNQLLGFAGDLGLQLFVASPDQDGVRREVAYSTSLFVLKDENFDVHLFPNYFENPNLEKQLELLKDSEDQQDPLEFRDELTPYAQDAQEPEP